MNLIFSWFVFSHVPQGKLTVLDFLSFLLLLVLELFVLVLIFPALSLLRSVCCFYFSNWRHWFSWCPGFLQWWHLGLSFSGFGFVACFFTVFIWSSSGAFKQFRSNFFLICFTICLYVPFSKWAWFIDFFRCGGIFAFMNRSMTTWAAISKESFASFWSSSKNSINFWFVALKTEICVSPELLTGSEFLLNSLGSGCWFYSTSATHHHWKIESSLSCCFHLDGRGFWDVWKRWNSSNFSVSSSKVGIVVVRDLGSIEILLTLFFKLAELLLLANCLKVNKNWPASIVAVVNYLQNCGWLVERAFSCFSDEYPGGGNRQSVLEPSK